MTIKEFNLKRLRKIVWISIAIFYLSFSYILGYQLLVNRNMEEMVKGEKISPSVHCEECWAIERRSYNEANFYKGLKFISSPFWSPIVEIGMSITSPSNSPSNSITR